MKDDKPPLPQMGNTEAEWEYSQQTVCKFSPETEMKQVTLSPKRGGWETANGYNRHIRDYLKKSQP